MKLLKGPVDVKEKSQTIPGKSFFRIGEVSRILGVEPHVVRYWESEFRYVKPIRTKSDQRLYRRKDLETLLYIKKLLYEDKFTIEGALKKMKSERREKTQPICQNCQGLFRELKKGLLEIRAIIR